MKEQGPAGMGFNGRRFLFNMFIKQNSSVFLLLLLFAAGVAFAVVVGAVVGIGMLTFIGVMISREKQGKPIFMSLNEVNAKPAPVSSTFTDVATASSVAEKA